MLAGHGGIVGRPFPRREPGTDRVMIRATL